MTQTAEMCPSKNAQWFRDTTAISVSDFQLFAGIATGFGISVKASCGNVEC